MYNNKNVISKNNKGKLIIKKLFNQIKKILKIYFKIIIKEKINIEQFLIIYLA